jgi:hypothetical protein
MLALAMPRDLSTAHVQGRIEIGQDSVPTMDENRLYSSDVSLQHGNVSLLREPAN